MKVRLALVWERLRTSLWFVPSAMTVAAALLAVIMIGIDVDIKAGAVGRLDWIYSGGADGARQILSTIAGSMITVAGVAFSITIVALTLASQQFGPRLLRNFMRDLGNQVVLGTYIATFIYCLLVLRTIEGGDDDVFVPHASVSVAVALAMFSFGVLIYFIHHVSSSIRAATIISTVAAELRDAIDRLYPERVGGEAPEAGMSAELDETDGVEIRALRGGYVQMIDAEELLRIASACNLLVGMQVRPGDFIVTGDRIALVRADGAPDNRTCRRIAGTIVTGAQRTITQDAEFAVDQLVEIAVRALSPGVNDPFTAITCVDQLGAALCRLAGRDYPSPVRSDRAGTPRVVAEHATFVEIARAAFDQIRQHARTDVAVSMRLLEALASIAARVRRAEDVAEVARQARLVVEGLDRSTVIEADRLEVEERFDRVIATLDRHRRAAVSPPAPSHEPGSD